jgi:integrase
VKGLRLSDIDLFNRTITVRRATTKTDAGRRLIPVNDAALWAVARLRDRAVLLWRLFQSTTCSFHFWIVARGERVRPRPADEKLAYGLARTAERGWIPTLRFYDLRDTCITKLAEDGTPNRTLMAISGHISPEMIRHYSHIRSKQVKPPIAR